MLCHLRCYLQSVDAAQEHRTPLQLVKKVSAAVMSFLRGQDTSLGGKRKLKRDAGDATRVLVSHAVIFCSFDFVSLAT
jgi:hypothetical protein